MRRVEAVVAVLSFVAVVTAQTQKTLDIYLVDVEGGNATLFVGPSGESLLIDTGNGGAAAARDGDRIIAAVNEAGLRQIDHLITSTAITSAPWRTWRTGFRFASSSITARTCSPTRLTENPRASAAWPS
jgi:hypothetical protein